MTLFIHHPYLAKSVFQEEWAERTCIQEGIYGQHRRFTYREFKDHVEQVSAFIAKTESRVIALLADNSADWVAIDLACQRLGKVCIPIPSFFSEAQIQYCLNSAGVDLMLTDKSGLYVEAAVALAQSVFQSIQAYRLKHTPAELPHGTQKITFTSGSTGAPKGVCLSLENQWRVAASLAEHVGLAACHHLGILPFSTLLENIAGIYSPLLTGGQITILSEQERGLSGSSGMNLPVFLNALSQVQANSLILFPQIVNLLVAATEQGWQLPDSYAFLAVGGAKVSAELLAHAQACRLPVYQGYGLSECASVVALSDPGSPLDAVGKILPHLSVQIDKGEIVVRSNSFLGYLNQPESWYPEAVYTGDLGTMNEAMLKVSGRRSNLLISSFGRNISPEWVESELSAQPLFTQCVVGGNDQPYLHALLSAAEQISDAQIQAHLDTVNRTLPDYAQVKVWLRIPASAWQGLYTANGRPKRQAITEHFAKQIHALYQSTISLPSVENTMSFYQTLQQQTEAGRHYLLSAPIIHRALKGEISLEDYVAFLSQAYHHVKHTVPLLMATGARIPEAKEWLRNAIAEYIEEELGHQEWILNDIQHCGFDKEQVRASQPNASTELMVAYAYDIVNRVHPLGFFGMVHVLEGTSVNIAELAADKIQEKLGLSNKAFTYLHSHGKLDQDHIKFFEGIMNQITDPAEQDLIIHSANRFYQLYGNIFRELETASRDQLKQAA
jgi:long-subunit acyl-CoA synthetase (AMP-forming)/pyrroloquinoline quinone (PQQ) biosynthesis protein C